MALDATQLLALQRHVIDLPTTTVPDRPSRAPTTEEDFSTSTADLDAIIDALDTFVTAQRKKSKSRIKPPVPVVLYAHGGLVGKSAGLRIAQNQVGWWKSNGAFPVQFVWHTGFAESLWQAVTDAVSAPRDGAIDNLWNTIIEGAARAGQGGAIWNAMKTKAQLVCSERDGGGAELFAEKLGTWMGAHEGWVTIHAVGHSAGSIFHSYLLPAALRAGVPRIDSLTLLAPAVTVDLFKTQLLELLRSEQIDEPSIFTMRQDLEEKDNCVGVYRASLLYLISRALEKEHTPILGLQESIFADPDLRNVFDRSKHKGTGDTVWSQTADAATPRSRSQSTSHGGFDGDPETMTSVAWRVLGAAPAVAYPAARGLEDELWPPAHDADRQLREAMERNSAAPAQGTRRALCIGIDDYPAKKHKLKGCVADATQWKAAFEAVDFTVDLLTDSDATRAEMVKRLTRLVTSSKPGDVIAIQYSGHGTTVVDANDDEVQVGERFDEALCPVDFAEGNLLIDDDLGAIWDKLPDGVSLTAFFDSCHSGDIQRDLQAADIDADPGARYVNLSPATVRKYVAIRGTTLDSLKDAPQTRDLGPRLPERGVFFSACQSEQVAYESKGHGDFTTRAVPLLRMAYSSMRTNEQLFESVIAAFDKDFDKHPRQRPVLLTPPQLAGQRVLSPVDSAGKAGDTSALASSLAALSSGAGTGTGTGTGTGAGAGAGTGTGTGTAGTDAKVAALLRAIADLIES